MQSTTLNTLATRFAVELATRTTPDPTDDRPPGRPSESGFEIAQSMGIALLGLVVAAAFATALEALGVDVITRIRTELGL